MKDLLLPHVAFQAEIMRSRRSDLIPSGPITPQKMAQPRRQNSTITHQIDFQRLSPANMAPATSLVCAILCRSLSDVIMTAACLTQNHSWPVSSATAASAFYNFMHCDFYSQTMISFSQMFDEPRG